MDSKATTAKTIDGYLAALKPEDRKALEAVRRTIRAAAPQATEFISYGIPAYRHNGNLVSFAAFKNHLTLFAGRAINKKFAKDLKRFEQTKGGIHFTPETPIPAALITRIVKSRARENETRARRKQT